MKYHLYSFTLVILTVIIIILPLTFAPWTVDNEPQEPPNLLEPRTCAQWITYNGFSPNNSALNKDLAKDRAFTVDYKAFFLSAGYAYFISNYTSTTVDFVPQKFCEDRGVTNPEVFFWAVKDIHRTCYDWIFIYGYEFLEGSRRNYEIATSRDRNADDFISHFAAGYGQFLSDTSKLVSPKKYCSKLKVDSELLLPLLPRNIPFLTCQSWLKLHGFFDDAGTNRQIARHIFTSHYHSQIHLLAKLYKLYLLDPADFKMNPALWCEANNMDGDTPIRFYAE